MGNSSVIMYIENRAAFPKIWKNPPKKCSVEELGCNHMEQVPLTLLTARPEVEMPVNNRNLHPSIFITIIITDYRSTNAKNLLI